MHNRLRLMMGATALLYLGPLLAGLGGFGWRMVPAFVGIFLLWTVILRPSTWPRTAADWIRSAVMVPLLGQSLMQVLLVVVCFGIGRGLGGVFGALPPFPALLPLAVSFLAIPLCRLLWDPNKAEAMDRFLDTAIAGISAAASDLPPDRSDARALAARLLTPLQALPDTTPDEDVARHLQAITRHADPGDVAHVLLAAAQNGTASPAGLRALVLHATDPHHTDRLGGSTVPSRAFGLIAQDPALTLLFARRSASQLRVAPAAWRDSVAPETLRSVAAASPPDVATALTDLAGLTPSMTPSEPTINAASDPASDRHHAGI